MTTVISEVGLFTVANGAIIGPKLDEVDVRLGTFVDVIITSTLNGIPIDQFVLASNVQTLRNKSFEDTTCRFIDAVDTTRFINFDCDGLTGTGTTIAGSQTANRTLTLPDTSDTFAVLAFPQTFTNKTITGATNTVEASALRTTGAAVVISGGAPPIAGHVLTALTPTTAAWAAGGGGGGGPPFDDATFTVTDVGDPSIQFLLDVAGTTGTSTTIRTAQVANRIYTIPDSGADTSFVMLAGAQTITGTKTIGDIVITGTLNTQPVANIVYTTAAQTLTNKTLTAPVIATIVNTGTLTLPTTTDTLVGRATTDTLTNKNITGATNVVDANALKTTGASVNVAAGIPPTVGQVLTATSATTATWQTNAAAPTVFTDTDFAVTDTVDPTKSVRFDVIGSTGTVTTLATTSTVNRTLTLPDATDTLVGTTTVQTLTNKNLDDLTTFITDTVDPTVRISFEAAGTTGTTTTLQSSQTVDRTITLPNLSTTLVGLNTTDTLLNKTIQGVTNVVHANAIKTNGISVTTTAASPPTTGQVLTAVNATTANWQDIPTIFTDAAFAVTDTVDPTKSVRFDVIGSTGTVTTLATTSTVNRTLTLPDATDTLVALAATQTLTNKNLSDTTTFIVDSVTPTIRIGFNAAGTAATTTTITSSQTVNRTLTLPNATDTFAVLALAQTFTNKNLSDTTTFITDATTPTIRIGFNAAGTAATTTTITSSQTANRTLTMPDATDTFAVLAATQTFTNKTITGSTNTVDAAALRTTGAAVNVSAGAPPTIGQVLTATSATTATWQAAAGGGPPFSDLAFSVFQDADPSSQVVFQVVGSPGTTATIQTANTIDRTYTIPEVGSSASFVLTNGTQTINGFKTFTGRVIIAEYDSQDPLGNLWWGQFTGTATTTGSNNTGLSSRSLQSLTTGILNVAVGYQTLINLVDGDNNTAVGTGLGASIVSSIGNSLFGTRLGDQLTGGENVIAGYQSGNSLTTGNANIVIGRDSMSSVPILGAPVVANANTGSVVVGSLCADQNTGSDLYLFGYNILNGGTGAPFPSATGSANIAIGRNICPIYAMNTRFNVFMGTNIGNSASLSTVLVGNVAIGHSVMNIATASSDNCIVGNFTAGGITTGSQNIIFGGTNAANLTTAGANTIVGYNNLNGPTTQTNGSIIIGTNNYNSVATSGTILANILIGSGMAGVATTATGNIGIGGNAGLGSVFANITSAGSNIAIGDSACASLTEGGNNIVIGSLSLAFATTASSNTVIGVTVLGALISGTQNVGIGYDAARNMTSDNNVCIGAITGNLFTSGTGNVIIGFNSGSPSPSAGTVNSTSNNALVGTQLAIGNTGSGLYMLGYNNFRSQGIPPYDPASGNDNIAIGRDIAAGIIGRTAATNIFIGSLMATNATSANNNVAIGHASVAALTTGTNNVIIGCNAGTTLTTGQFNVILGDLAEIGPAFNNCVALGYGANVTFGNNTVTLGNPATVRLEAQVALTVLSDARYKEDIEDLPFGTEFIKALKPKKYKITKSDTQRYGFLAQDIEETMVQQRIIEPFDKKNNQMDGILSYNAHDDKYSMSYEGLLAPMIKMMQEMQARIEALEAQLAAM